MEELMIHSSPPAAKLNPLQASVNKGLDKERLQRNAVPEKKEQTKNDDTFSADTSELVKQVNQFVDRFSTKVAFSYDPESKEAQIVVTEKETGKIIRQIPPKEMLELKKKMQEIAGIIFNGRV